jgi:peptide/nickel transport system ATP-binding protein
MTVLSVKDLSVNYKTQGRLQSAVLDVTFSLGERNVLGLVGESGSGKTSMGLAIMRLLPKNAITKGIVEFQDADVMHMQKSAVPSVRGTGMSMIFQEPMTSLNPVMRVSDQLAEAINIRRERSLSRNPIQPYQLSTYNAMTEGNKMRSVRSWLGMGGNGNSSLKPSSLTFKEIADALRKVRISDPERTAGKYPHELSGGERQRVMIAMAYLLRPKVLIADEPTTALDVTTQAQILKLMLELRNDIGTSILLISHDLLIVGQIADNVAVMYAGEILEIAPTEILFTNPMHPYTKGLMESIPKGFKGERRVNPIQPSPQGEIPQLLRGCKFHTRCPYVMETCKINEPSLKEVEPNHFVSCHLF